MITITGTNVNEVFKIGIHMLAECGVEQASQHGKTLEMEQPVSVLYLNPRERCLFDKDRASNPFLNLFEALWIIEGREDAKFLERLVPNMKNYSDDGKTYFGAYGARMRGTSIHMPRINVNEKLDSGVDQIEQAIVRLKANPDDRQVVLTIRQPSDMAYTGKDQPCNLMVACKIRNGKLNIHVFNRSNDFVWGMTGTNVVQFSMLQEYLAGRIGVEVGSYHQTTDSMHVYVNDQWDKLRHKRPNGQMDPYETGDTAPFPMMHDGDDGRWDNDLMHFFNCVDTGDMALRSDFDTPFFRQVVHPMWAAFLAYERYRASKEMEDLEEAIQIIDDHVTPCDWQLAAFRWLKQIEEKAK